MAGIQARIAFFQNQSNAPPAGLANRPFNHPILHPVQPAPPPEAPHPHIVVPKPSAPGPTPLLAKVKLAPLNPLTSGPEPPTPSGSPRAETHLPRLGPSPDPQPKVSFRDKVAMLGSIKGGGMGQHDYQPKPRPIEPEPDPEPRPVPEPARPALPVLVRPIHVARRPTALD
jgi:hypothetical protein